jgi:hypothetical protein
MDIRTLPSFSLNVTDMRIDQQNLDSNQPQFAKQFEPSLLNMADGFKDPDGLQRFSQRE